MQGLIFTTKLGRLIFRKFVALFGALTVSLIAIVCVIDYFENLGAYILFQPTSYELWIQYQLNFILYLFDFLTPLITFITTMLLIRSLTKHGELTAMLSGGLTIRSIHFKILQIAFLISIVTFLLGAFVNPHANYQREKFKIKYIDGDPEISDHFHLMISDTSKIYFERYDYEEAKGNMFAYEEFKESQLTKIVKAESAKWNHLKNYWELKHYSTRIFDGTNEIITSGDYLTLSIPFGQLEIHEVLKGLESYTLRELISAAHDTRQQSVRQSKEFIFFLTKKVTFPFAAPIFCLLAISFSNGTNKKNLVTRIVIGFFFCFAYWACLQYSLSLYRSSINPFIALTVPNLLFLLAALIQLRLSTHNS